MSYTPTNLCCTFEDHNLRWIRGELMITSTGCEIISLVDWGDLLVTAVPVPLVSWLDRKEVVGALVLHFLGESQEDPEVDVSHCRCIRRPWRNHSGHWYKRGGGLPQFFSESGGKTVRSIVFSVLRKTRSECLFLGRTSRSKITTSQ